MQTNLLWRGVEYYSLENCLVSIGNIGNKINSTIVGCYQDKIYTIAYHMETDATWQTHFVEIEYSINDKQNKIILRKESDNYWLLNNSRADLFKHCTDVDIAVTPFTNSLPINRLQLSLQEEKKIRLIYINILNNEVKAVEQSYRRVADSKYLYQNIPNDFEAEIEVDEYGFVVDYPSLFKRTAIVQSI